MALVKPSQVGLARPAAQERPAPFWALIMRTLLFAGFQALFALLFYFAGKTEPWSTSTVWWMFTATLTNLVCIGLLDYWMRQEGAGYWDLFRIDRTHWKLDVLVVLGLLVLSLPLMLIPNFGIATLLFGNAQVAVPLLFQPLPAWAIWTGIVVFPVTIALAELPWYFGYAMPRLGQGWGAVLLTAFCLSAQHAALPLVFDLRFIIWRATMFSLFAVLLAVALRWRPRLLAYLVIVHGLLDLATALTFLSLR